MTVKALLEELYQKNDTSFLESSRSQRISLAFLFLPLLAHIESWLVHHRQMIDSPDPGEDVFLLALLPNMICT
jgi:hypothetical protein